MLKPPHQATAHVALFSFLVITTLACSTTPTAESDEAQKITTPDPPLSALPKQPPEPTPPPNLTEHLRYSSTTIDLAITQASKDAIGTQRPLKSPLTYREILDPQRQPPGSLSLGTVRAGALRQPARLEASTKYHEILKSHRPRQTAFGTAELIQAIQTAAKDVHTQLGGAPLQIGNISLNKGGRIPWSNSHQAGRDADLAIYCVNPHGESLPTPGLISFDDQGKAIGHELFFDAPRNWALVRSLLLNHTINVQWIFISEALKDLLLDHAHEIHEDPELIHRAAHILHQPTDAPPHNDHLHLRIGCPLQDRLEGCVDWGPRWPWYDWHDEALLTRTRELQRALDDQEIHLREQALATLLTIRSPWAPEVALFKGLHDSEPSVRARALAILDEMPPQTTAGVLAIKTILVEENITPETQEILYEALRKTQNPAAAQIALASFQDTRLDDHERALALRALDHRMLPELVPELLDALKANPSPEHRRSIARLLYRITARDDGFDWSTDPSHPEYKQALQAWHTWLQDQPTDREGILKEFLQRRGIDAWKELKLVDQIIPLLRSNHDFERYNANIILSNWTGRWAPHDWDDPSDAHRSWSRWWTRNRERMLHRRPKAWE